MNVVFLSAAVRLSKTHTLTADGGYKTENYPMVKNFTSTEVNVDSVKSFYDALCSHAKQGHALLKGQLTEPLNNESKAGKVDRLTETEFLVFDLDGLNLPSIEEFIQRLPEDFHHVSYVLQYSASHGLTPNKLRAHLFFLLGQPTIPSLIKWFLIDLNLRQFIEELQLNPGNLTLGYPLDTGINANATPIYIAPPTCIGFDDPCSNRIQYIEKSGDRVSYNFSTLSAASIEENVKRAVKTLRRNLGLRDKKLKLDHKGPIEIITNIEPATLYGQPFEERGFVYLPLNAKNRHSYYHPIDNPSIIFNFKGEPAAETARLLPEYWATVNPENRLIQTNQNNPGKQFLIFRELRLDTYFNGWSTDQSVELYPTRAKDRLEDFARQNNLVMPDPIPDWIMEFAPTQPFNIDWQNQRVNTFRMTDYLQTATANPKPVAAVPPTIQTIISSVVGNDDECYNHFLNWLAFIVQKREQTKTAWVFQGVEGTGKGILFNLILKPILGTRYCKEKMIKDLAENFNDWRRECLLILFDETKHQMEGGFNQKDVHNRLKNLITEPDADIRAMRTNSYQVTNYNNCLFATNDNDALQITDTDRRFNICPEQKVPYVAPLDLEERLSNELQDFTHYLMNFTVNETAVRVALSNTSKERMKHASMGSFKFFFTELRKGNFAYFADQYWDSIGVSSGPYILYKSIIRSWAQRWDEKQEDFIFIRRDEILAIFACILGENGLTVAKFSRLLTKNGLVLERRSIKDFSTRYHINGINDPWKGIPVIAITWTQGLDILNDVLNDIKESP